MKVEWKKITKQFYGFYLLQTWYQPHVVSESVSLAEYEYKTSTVGT